MELIGIKFTHRAWMLFIIHLLVFMDIIFITVGLLLDLPDDVSYFILLFDLMICIFLLLEWIISFHHASSKKEFLRQKENWVTLIASIPYEILFPAVIPGANLIRYIMLFKLLRIIVLYNKFFSGFKKFIRKTNLDLIFGGIFFTVILFTMLYIVCGSSTNLFESFYFVIVTLTTVGYGDIVPTTFNEKIITILLIVVGIFIVSTITAGLSSYLTDRLIGHDEGLMIEDVENVVKENSREVMDELKNVREENRKLHEEINELKELIKKE